MAFHPKSISSACPSDVCCCRIGRLCLVPSWYLFWLRTHYHKKNTFMRLLRDNDQDAMSHHRAEVVSLTDIGWWNSYQATLPTCLQNTCSEVLKFNIRVDLRYTVTHFRRCLGCAKQHFFFHILFSKKIFEIAAAVWIAKRKATECTHPFRLNLAIFGHLAMCI